ncbi:hypothetical protein HDU93_008117 [Gonapodya sp. JEL0774]|nr:hypothetical protein HDU93_008117 [Gonapodya sp. JEL0774]
MNPHGYGNHWHTYGGNGRRSNGNSGSAMLRRDRDREEGRTRNVAYADSNPSSGRANTSAFMRCPEPQPGSEVVPLHFHSLSSLFFYWSAWVKSLNSLPQTMIASMQSRIARFFSPPAVLYAASNGMWDVYGVNVQRDKGDGGDGQAEASKERNSDSVTATSPDVPILYIGTPLLHSATASSYAAPGHTPDPSHTVPNDPFSHTLIPKYILDDAGVFALRHQLESFLSLPYDSHLMIALARADSPTTSIDPDPSSSVPATLPWTSVLVILPFPKWDAVQYHNVHAAPILYITSQLALHPSNAVDTYSLRTITRRALTMGFDDDIPLPVDAPWDDTDLVIAERTMETCQAANGRRSIAKSLHTVQVPDANDPEAGNILKGLIEPGTFIVGSSKNPLVKSYRSAHTLPNEPKLLPCPSSSRSIRASRTILSALHLTCPAIVPPHTIAALTRNPPDSQARPAVFLSVDLEAHDVRQDRVIEMGWSVYNGEPDRQGDENGGRITTCHAVIREHAHRRNGKWVRDAMGEFHYGEASRIDRSEADGWYTHPDHLPHVAPDELQKWRERGTMVLGLEEALERCLRDVSALVGVEVSGKLVAVGKRSIVATVGTPTALEQPSSPVQSTASALSTSHGLIFTVPNPMLLRSCFLVGAEPPADFAFFRTNGIDLPQILAAHPAFTTFDWRVMSGSGLGGSAVMRTFGSDGSERIGRGEDDKERGDVPGMDLSDPLLEYDLGGPVWYDILHSLSIPPTALHNAGNDAHLTLAAFLRMLDVARAGMAAEGERWADGWRVEWNDVHGGVAAVDEAEKNKEERVAAVIDRDKGLIVQEDKAGLTHLPPAEAVAAELIRARRTRFVAAVEAEEDLSPAEPLWPKPEWCAPEGTVTGWDAPWPAAEEVETEEASRSGSGWDQEVTNDWASGWQVRGEVQPMVKPWWEGRGRGKGKGSGGAGAEWGGKRWH